MKRAYGDETEWSREQISYSGAQGIHASNDQGSDALVRCKAPNVAI